MPYLRSLRAGASLIDIFKAGTRAHSGLRFRPQSLRVVSASVDYVAEIAAFAASQKIEYAMLSDPEGAINLSL